MVVTTGLEAYIWIYLGEVGRQWVKGVRFMFPAADKYMELSGRRGL